MRRINRINSLFAACYGSLDNRELPSFLNQSARALFYLELSASERSSAGLGRSQRGVAGIASLPPDHFPEEEATSGPLNEDAAAQASDEVVSDATLTEISQQKNGKDPFSGKNSFVLQRQAIWNGGKSSQRHVRFRNGEREWVLDAGSLATMASGSISLRAGNTTVLATVVSQPRFNNRKDASLLSLPFRVDYREKLYAVGRIPGTYNKREVFPREHETLASRRMERALRTLLPRGYVYDTDVTAAVLSADGSEDPEVVALNAASAALTLSHVPWSGPLGAARVTLVGDHIFVNEPPFHCSGDAEEEVAQLKPNFNTDISRSRFEKQGRGDASSSRTRSRPKERNKEEKQRTKAGMMEVSEPDASFLIAATEESIVLFEVETREPIPESKILEAVRVGMSAVQEVIEAQKKLIDVVRNPTKDIELAGADPAANLRLMNAARLAASEVLRSPDMGAVDRAAALSLAKIDLTNDMKRAGAWRADFSRVPGTGCVSTADIDHAFAAALNAEWRKMLLDEGIRPDGRGPIDIRDSDVALDAIPVVHGSSVFNLGETQVLSTVTVGIKSEQQRMESLLGGESSKRMFVHYTLPEFAIPFSQHDSGAIANTIHNNGFSNTPFGGIARHEIDRSAFIEKAILPVLPSLNAFPFSFRLNADSLGVDGGAVGAAICGCTMALMDAGVPLKSLVAGVSVGLVSERGMWSGECRMLDATVAEQKSLLLGRSELLTDPTGLETTLGDMELRIAGTDKGITAIQLESQVSGGVTLDVLERGVKQGRIALERLLSSMQSRVPKQRHAESPAFGMVKIPPMSIRRVIGKEGSTLRSIESATRCRIQIEDDGTVSIFAPDQSQLTAARRHTLRVAGEFLEVGKVYKGRVMSVKDFGVLLKIPGCEVKALLHVSDVGDTKQVKTLATGKEIDVIYKGRDNRGTLLVTQKTTTLVQ